MTAKLWEFEGEMLTIAEIAKRVPALSRHTVRHHLEAGRNTRQAMLTFDHHAARRKAGKIGAKKCGLSMRFGRGPRRVE